MNKVNEKAIDDIRKRAAEIRKTLAPLRATLAKVDQEHTAVQKERAALADRMKQYETTLQGMTETEYIAADGRIRLLTQKSKTLGDQYAAANSAMRSAEAEANSELNGLCAKALGDHDRAVYREREELKKAVYKAAATLQEKI